MVSTFLEKNTDLASLSLPLVTDFPLSRLAILIEPMHMLTQVTMAWPTFNRIAPELLKIVAGQWKLVQKSPAYERLYLKFACVRAEQSLAIFAGDFDVVRAFV